MSSYEIKVDEIVERKMGQATVLFPVSSDYGTAGKIYELNETAAFIWECLKRDVEIQKIPQELCETFEGVDSTEATADMETVLESLEKLGALARA